MRKYVLILLFLPFGLSAGNSYTENFFNTIDIVPLIDSHVVVNDWSYDITSNELIIIAKTVDENNKNDFGYKLFHYKKTNRMYKQLFVSTPCLDSYIMKPHFYFLKNNRSKFLILCEIGAESSWGLRVFSYNEGEIVDIGNIDVSYLNDQTDTRESIVSKMIIAEVGSKIVFKFRGSVVYNPESIDEKQVDGEKISYIFDGKKLKAVIRN